ncbi:MAG: hypothetical protein OXE55_05205 [Flavobacteriaceae bacterium]|nr:hypothetical protein [Flavobacteriaceae bacterium]
MKRIKRYSVRYSFFGARRMLRWILMKHPELKQLHLRALSPNRKTTRRSQSPEPPIFPY